ncbi:hypothetical protein ABPG74_000788 [Tetrahymena malaccensis]
MGCQNSTGQVSTNEIKQIEKVVLGYWAFPLRGQPIRYILELANYPYTETKYTPSTATEWFGKDKLELGLDFPNLPYLIHGDFSITESQNIVNYLIQLTNQQSLQGEGELKYKVDNIRFVCDDLISKIFLSTRKNDEEKKTDLNTQIIPKIKQLQKVLGKQNSFFNKLTLADIYGYTAINNFKKTYPQEYEEFASTFDPLLKRFEEIPIIKKYHQSDRYFK